VKNFFVANLAFLLFVNILVKPFWIFGIDRTVQNTVGAQEYGLYASLFSLSIILNIILDFGITNFNSRNIAQNSMLLRKYFSNIVCLKFLLGLVYLAVCLVCAAALGYSERQVYLLLVLCANQFLLSGILYFRSNLAGLHIFKYDSLLSVADRLVAIAACSVLLFVWPGPAGFTVEMFIYAQTFAYSAAFCAGFALVLARAEFFRLRFNRAFMMLIIRQSFPFALLVLLMGLYTRVDMVMLERMLRNGAEQAGIYMQAFRILDAAAVFGLLFANILLPMFSRMIKKNESIEQLTVLSFGLIMAPTLISTSAIYVYSTEIISLLYTAHADESAAMLRLLILGFPAFSATYIFGTLLTANSSLKLLNYMAAGGMALNFAINLALIPRYGALGAASASVATQAAAAIVQLIMASAIFRFKINFPRILSFIAFAASQFAVFFFLKGALHNWLWEIAVSSIIAGLIALVLKVIDIRANMQAVLKQ
jgi:O-antigen/teichoic acid export membrane protein